MSDLIETIRQVLREELESQWHADMNQRTLNSDVDTLCWPDMTREFPEHNEE